MPRLSRGSIVHLQAINEVIVFVSRAPKAATHSASFYLRALRGKMRMSQAQLAIRSRVDQSHIARIELGKVEADLATLRRLFDALYCDLIVIPKPRQQLGDAIAERNAEARRPGHRHTNIWKGDPTTRNRRDFLP